MTMKEKAEQILQKATEFALASVSEEGYPRICVISRTDSQGIRKVYGSTGLSSTKVRHFRNNPKAGLCVYGDGNSITLTGEVAILTDRAIREAMWQDWFIEHYPGGVDDPNYCVLEFTAREATMWIDCEFATIAVEA